MAMDWEEVRRADLAQRKERRAKKNGNGRHTAAQKIVVVGSEAFRAEILAELYRLWEAERPERISGAKKLQMRLRGQRGCKDLFRAADRLTAHKTPRRLFDDDSAVEKFTEVEEAAEV